VENGRAFWHGVPIDYPDYPHAQAREARVYLRPHELDITRAPSGSTSESHAGTSLAATVLRQTRTGPITRITCQPRQGGSDLHVDLPSAAARELGLQPGESVSITPRHVRVFLPDPEYVI
jgi:sulfate transport system ATP-binding protein